MKRFAEDEVTLTRILIDSIVLAGNNLLVITPCVFVSITTLASASVLIGGSALPMETISAKAHDPRFLQSFFLLSCISFILQVFAQGVTISMVNDLLDRRICSLRDGFTAAFRKLNDLMIASFIIFFGLFLGIIFFLIPAIILGFVLMFTVVIIVTEDIHAIEAMKKSCLVVRANLSSAVLLFLIIAGTGLFLGLMNPLLVELPAVGGMIFAFLSGLHMSLMAIVMVRFYRKTYSKGVD
ncbi:MAG: hypothetical protein U5R49_04570 [Deltaproteobacteria bacterium]|nr:hypothetical protein [Deltaproteobacteria bacterium]